MKRALPVLACAMILTACGFHLQGSGTLPAQMQSTWIQWPANASPELQRSLPRSLRSGGVSVVTRPEDASAILQIIENDYGERILSVSATNIPEELEVYHSVTFELRAGEEVLFSRETILVTRDYIFDETAVLAKRREGELIADALVRDVVQQMRRRLALLD